MTAQLPLLALDAVRASRTTPARLRVERGQPSRAAEVHQLRLPYVGPPAPLSADLERLAGPRRSLASWALLLRDQGVRECAFRLDDAGGELERRGWHRVVALWARGASTSTSRRLYGLEDAVAHELELGVRRWLARAGWQTMPDGTSVRRPSREGLLAALRVELDSVRPRAEAIEA